jgi:hypothetical protein
MEPEPSSPALNRAVEAMDDFVQILRMQIEGAQAERETLCSLAYDRLLEQSRERNSRNAWIADASRTLQAALADIAGELGLNTISVSEIVAHCPAAAELLWPAFERLTTTSAELRQIDDANQRLIRRTLAAVKRARTRLAPEPVAYDRRGSCARELHSSSP